MYVPGDDETIGAEQLKRATMCLTSHIIAIETLDKGRVNRAVEAPPAHPRARADLTSFLPFRSLAVPPTEKGRGGDSSTEADATHHPSLLDGWRRDPAALMRRPLLRSPPPGRPGTSAPLRPGEVSSAPAADETEGVGSGRRGEREGEETSYIG